MIKINVSEAIKKQLKQDMDKHPHALIRKRCRIVYLKSSHVQHGIIAQTVGCCLNTVTSVLKLYQKEGVEGLYTLKYKGQPSKLHAYREAIQRSLEAEPVSTLVEAQARIEALTGIHRSHPAVSHFLKGLGFKRRRPKAVPAKANPEEQADFQKKNLEPLIKQAKNDEIHLFFLDAAHFIWKGYSTFLYTLVLTFFKVPAGRFRYNLLGAVHATSKQVITVTNTTRCDGSWVCVLFHKICQQYGNTLPIYIVLDNAPYQRAYFVQSYAQKLGITLVYLPTYSPHLNLIERLWRLIKKQTLYNHYYPSQDLFCQAIDTCLETLNTQQQSALESLLTLKFQSFSFRNSNL